MSERIIETVGTITKKELIASVEHETYSNKMVIENQEPYPGYHGTTVPDRMDPDSIFAITKLQYNDERIYRAISSVKKATSHNFDGAAGTLTYQNKGYNCVRFKQLPYRLVGEVLDEFEKNGVEFRKARKVAPFQSMIRVRKFFSIKEMSDGIYQDEDEKEITYLEIPLLLRWPTFEKITLNIKYNMEDKVWDAAQTSMYYKNGLKDFVRIYDEDSCLGKLIHIREKYLEAIAKM
jgi:hypothetical protein